MNNTPSDDLLLREYLKQYALERVPSKKYADQIGYTIDCFERFLGRLPRLCDLTTANVNTWLAALSETMSPVTLRGYKRRILSLWRGAFEAELLNVEPKRIRKIIAPRSMPKCWTPEELSRLLAVAEMLQGRFKRNRLRVLRAAYWRAFILVAYSTGLRLGDLERLRFDDIGANSEVVVVQSKTGVPVVCRLLPQAIEAINAVRRPKRDTIFGGVLCRRAFYDLWTAIVRSAGLEGTTRWLRRSSGTAVELLSPGQGHLHLGNGPDVFRKHYLDARHLAAQRPLPPPIQPLTFFLVPNPHSNPDRVELSPLIREYSDYLRTQGRHNEYRCDVVARLRTVLKTRDRSTLSNLRPEELVAAICALNVSEGTRSNYRSSVIGFLTWLVDVGGIGGNVERCLFELAHRWKGGAR